MFLSTPWEDSYWNNWRYPQKFEINLQIILWLAELIQQSIDVSCENLIRLEYQYLYDVTEGYFSSDKSNISMIPSNYLHLEPLHWNYTKLIGHKIHIYGPQTIYQHTKGQASGSKGIDPINAEGTRHQSTMVYQDLRANNWYI